MLIAPRVGDVDDENNILATKVKLTKNEYNATVRNKLEYNRLKTVNRYMNDQNDMKACKLRTTMYDLKKSLNDNQHVVCHSNEFFLTRMLLKYKVPLKIYYPKGNNYFERKKKRLLV